jgi:hypothetical protein
LTTTGEFVPAVRLMVLSLVSMEGEKKSVIDFKASLINRFFPFNQG